MNAPTNRQLSAPTDDFLADLNRFGVPFGVEINGRWVSTPSSAWRRVFDGPHGADGKPLRAGGIPAQIVKVMRAEALRLPGHRHPRSAPLPANPSAVSSCELYSAAVTAPPAREPAATVGMALTAQQAPMKKAT